MHDEKATVFIYSGFAYISLPLGMLHERLSSGATL